MTTVATFAAPSLANNHLLLKAQPFQGLTHGTGEIASGAAAGTHQHAGNDSKARHAMHGADRATKLPGQRLGADRYFGRRRGRCLLRCGVSHRFGMSNSFPEEMSMG
jgi:hypothetical protein